MIQDMNTDINTNIETNRQQQSLRDFIDAGQMGAFDGRKTTVTSGPKAQIDYQYDIGGDSIFATQQQAGLFGNPYGGNRAQPVNNPQGGFAQGGQVEDENDMLLRLLGEM